MRTNRLNLARYALLGALVLGGALSGCEDKPSPSGATSAAPSPPTAQAVESASSSAADSSEAVEKMWAHHQKVAELIDKNAKDCAKLGKELKTYADEHAKEMKELWGSSHAKLEAELGRKYGKQYDEVSDKILEATEIDCGDDKNVREAAKVMGL
jgi:membrane-associated HD superfamily phosphohydrolase